MQVHDRCVIWIRTLSHTSSKIEYSKAWSWTFWKVLVSRAIKRFNPMTGNARRKGATSSNVIPWSKSLNSWMQRQISRIKVLDYIPPYFKDVSHLLTHVANLLTLVVILMHIADVVAHTSNLANWVARWAFIVINIMSIFYS